MLSDFCNSWNSLFKNHAAEYHAGSVTIVEEGATAKNKTLTVNCPEAVSFPSKHFDSYDMFSALSNRNCDGAFLVANANGSYDLLYIEMKSRFDSREVFEAKCQIVETSAKMRSLLQMLQPFGNIPIRKIYGVIETQQLDADQEAYWLKLQMLPDNQLDFGWRLIKYGIVKAPTLLSTELNMPQQMAFKILLSDNANYAVNYSDLSDNL